MPALPSPRRPARSARASRPPSSDPAPAGTGDSGTASATPAPRPASPARPAPRRRREAPPPARPATPPAPIPRASCPPPAHCLQRRELLLAHLRADGLGSERCFHRAPPIRLGWGFGPHAASAPQRTGHGAVPSRFLAKGRGVIGLPLQQPQVATRVTRFQRFCLIASHLQPWRCVLRRMVMAAGPSPEPTKIGAVALVMWNMRRRHSSHSCQPAAAEPSVKADRREPRSGRSEAESLYGRRSGGYTRVSAPGCRFRPLALCFQQVPRVAATGYSRSNREQPISRSTAALLTGSRRSNLQQPCSTRAGVTCRPSSRCRRQRGSCGEKTGGAFRHSRARHGQSARWQA